MDVFLSYNRLDAGHAEALNDWLVSQGVRTFFDQRDLGGGQLWVADLERTIEHEVQAIAVLVGPNGIGNTQQYEYQLALTRQAKDRDFPLIPVVRFPGPPDLGEFRRGGGRHGESRSVAASARRDPPRTRGRGHDPGHDLPV
jgi:hypothetical protein